MEKLTWLASERRAGQEGESEEENSQEENSEPEEEEEEEAEGMESLPKEDEMTDEAAGDPAEKPPAALASPGTAPEVEAGSAPPGGESAALGLPQAPGPGARAASFVPRVVPVSRWLSVHRSRVRAKSYVHFRKRCCPSLARSPPGARLRLCSLPRLPSSVRGGGGARVSRTARPPARARGLAFPPFPASASPEALPDPGRGRWVRGRGLLSPSQTPAFPQAAGAGAGAGAGAPSPEAQGRVRAATGLRLPQERAAGLRGRAGAASGLAAGGEAGPGPARTPPSSCCCTTRTFLSGTHSGSRRTWPSPRRI